MLDGFTKALHDRDKKLNGKKSAKGVLNREDFIGVIDAFFPVKTDGDIKALRSALQYDQPLPVVNIDRIFEETANGDQGKFVETLRDQNLYDVMSCYPAIEDSIRRAVQYEKGGSAAVMAGGGGRLTAATDTNAAIETTVLVVRRGLLDYDAGITPNIMNKILACGRKAPPFLALPLSFCQRLMPLNVVLLQGLGWTQPRLRSQTIGRCSSRNLCSGCGEW